MTFTLFQANVPLMEKPGGWFFLAKCVKNTCGTVTFLLKMSLPQVFFTHFEGKNQLPGFSITGTLAGNALSTSIVLQDLS